MDYNKHLPFPFFGSEGLDFPVLHDASAHHWEQQFASIPFHITENSSFWIPVSSDSCDPDTGLELPHSCSPSSSEITAGRPREQATKDFPEPNAGSFRCLLPFYWKSPNWHSFKHLDFQENRLIVCCTNLHVCYFYQKAKIFSAEQNILCPFF